MTTTAPRGWATRASLACLGLMIVVPPLNPVHLAPLPSFIEEWLAFAFGTAATAFALWARGLRLGEVPRVVPWLVALAALLAVQAALRDLPYREQALLPAVYVLWAAALAWTGASLRETFGGANTARVLARCVLVAACVSALIVLVPTPLRGFFLNGPSHRLQGALGQANLFADLLALGAASAMFLLVDGRIARALAWGAVALLAVVLVLTGSRSGIVFAAWLVAWAAWTRKSAGNASPSTIGIAALFLAIIVVGHALFAWLSASTTLGSTVGPLVRPEADAQGGLSTRLYIWTQAVRIFADSPLLGVGPGMFAWNFFLHASWVPGMHVPGSQPYAHDFVLQLLAETGILGATLAVVPLVAWFWSNRASGSELWRWWAVAVAGILVLHGLAENPLSYAYFLGMLALVLGLGDRSYVVKAERVARIAAPALVVAGVLPLVGTAVGYVDTLAWLGGRPGATLAPMHRSMLRPYAEILASPTLLAGKRVDADGLAFSERLVRFMPIDLAVYRHIRLLAQAGRAEEARILLEHAFVAFPDTLGDLRVELASARGVPAVDELARIVDARVGK